MHASERTPLKGTGSDNGNGSDEETGTNSVRKQRIYALIHSESAREQRVDDEVSRSIRSIQDRSYRSLGRNNSEHSWERRFENLIRFLTVTAGILVGAAWLYLAYKSVFLLFSQDDTRSFHTLWRVYTRLMNIIFRAKAKDLAIVPLSYFLFFVVPMAVQTGVLTIAASIQAAKTIWIEDCFALICQVMYGLLLYNTISIIIWYFLFLAGDALDLVEKNEVCASAIIGIGSLLIGWLVQKRFIPEISIDRLFGF